jgi:WD40 repeat protein
MKSIIKIIIFTAMCAAFAASENGLYLYSNTGNQTKSFQENDDVLVILDGVHVRGWIIRTDGTEHCMVAFNSNVESVRRIANHDIKPNQYAKIQGDKKRLTGFTSSEPGAFLLANNNNDLYTALVSNKGEVSLFDKKSMELIKKTSLGVSVISAALSKNYLATCNLVEKKVLIYSIPDFKLRHQLNTTDGGRYLAFDNNERLAVQIYTKGIYIYDTKDKKISNAMFPEKSGDLITMLKFSDDGRYLFAALESKSKPGVIMYQSKGLSIENPKFIPTQDSVYTISLNRNGNSLAIGGTNSLSLFSLVSNKMLWTYKLQSSYQRVAIRKNSDQIIACSTTGDNKVYVYHSASNRTEIGEAVNCSSLELTDNNSVYYSRSVNSNFGEIAMGRIFLSD